MANVRLIDANSMKKVLEMSGSLGHIHTLKDVFDQMDIEPTIDPESLRPTGHWEESDYDGYLCSECG